MDALPLGGLIAILFPAIFAGFWLGMTWLIGWLSGWHALAARFPDRTLSATQQFTWRSGRMGPIGARFNNILRLDVCSAGLRLSLPWIFAVWNRPILVPWDDIQTTRVDGVLVNEVVLTLGRPKAGTLTISETLAKALAAAAPRGALRL